MRTTAGNYSFTVHAYNSGGTSSKNFTLKVEDKTVAGVPAAPSIETESLPNGGVNHVYGYSLYASGSAPITWTATGLPDGLAIDGNGYISGTPTADGTSQVTFTAKNSKGIKTKTLSLTILTQSEYEATVTESAPKITSSTLPQSVKGLAYGYPLQATGTAPITCTATNIPDGLTLSETGYLSGIPTTAGFFWFEATATNSIGSDTSIISLTVAGSAVKGEAPKLITTIPDNVLVGEDYKFQLMASVVSRNGCLRKTKSHVN